MTTTLGFTAYSPSSSVYAASYVCLGSGDVWCAAADAEFWRTTPAGVVTVNTTPGGSDLFHGSFPVGIVEGPDGYIYIPAYGLGSYYAFLWQVDPSTLVVNPTSIWLGNRCGLTNCIVGPDGNIWGYDFRNGQLDRYNVYTQVVTTWSAPTGGLNQLYSDGTYIWSCGGGYLQRIDMSGTVTSYYYSSDTSGGAIAPDGAGNFWIGGDDLWQVSPSGTLLATLTLPSSSSVRGGLLGPDGNPWFSDYNNDNLYPVDSAAGTYTTFTFRESGYSPPNTGGSPARGGPGVVGADSNMWWSSGSSQSIVKTVINPVTMQIVMMP